VSQRDRHARGRISHASLRRIQQAETRETDTHTDIHIRVCLSLSWLYESGKERHIRAVQVSQKKDRTDTYTFLLVWVPCIIMELKKALVVSCLFLSHFSSFRLPTTRRPVRALPAPPKRKCGHARAAPRNTCFPGSGRPPSSGSFRHRFQTVYEFGYTAPSKGSSSLTDFWQIENHCPKIYFLPGMPVRRAGRPAERRVWGSWNWAVTADRGPVANLPRGSTWRFGIVKAETAVPLLRKWRRTRARGAVVRPGAI